MPQPDVSRCSKVRALLDGLVGGHLHDQGYREAERLGGFEVDDQLVLGRCLNWELRRCRAAQDTIYVGAGPAIGLADVDAVGNQPPFVGKIAEWVDRRYAQARGEQRTPPPLHPGSQTP